MSTKAVRLVVSQIMCLLVVVQGVVFIAVGVWVFGTHLAPVCHAMGKIIECSDDKAFFDLFVMRLFLGGALFAGLICFYYAQKGMKEVLKEWKENNP